MQAAQLSAQLRSWAHEFASVSGETITVPERLWPFLAQRLAEQGVVAEDPDVVSAKFHDGYRKVRITGKQGARLCYEPTDGSKGFGLIDHNAVHPSERGRLTQIIERMVADGRIAG